VHNLHVRPGPGQALGDEAAVAMLRGGLAAKEAASDRLKDRAIQGGGDIPFVHKGFEAAHVLLPIPFFTKIIHHLFGGSQKGQIHLLAALGQFFQEVGQVLLAGKTGKLALRVDANIDQAPNAILEQQAKNLLALLWVKPMV
jgi:hypothetical protein